MSHDMPEGWAVKALGEVAQLIMGQSPPSSAVSTESGGLPFIQGNAEFGSRHPTPRLYASSTPKVVRAGDILLSVRAPVGEVNVAEGPLCIGRGIGGVRAANCDPDFLFYAIGGLSSTFARLSQGSTFDAINGKELRAIELTIPPLDEQRRIAGVLWSISESVRTTEAAVSAGKAMLTALRADLTDGPEEASEAQQVVSLHDICRPRQHPTISSKQLTSSGFPAYGANGQIGFYSSYTHESPVVAITCRGATCGTINWIPGKSYLTGNAMALDEVRTDLINERFLFHYLSAWGVAKSIAGSTQPQITRQSLNGIRIVLPELDEQIAIVALLDSVLAQLEASFVSLANLIRVRSEVTSDLLSGRARVPA